MMDEDLMRAQARALEEMGRQQKELIRDAEVGKAIRDIKSPAAKRTLSKLLRWRYVISYINAIWKPLADYALANDCDVARFDNAELVQECLYKQAQLLVSLDKGMEEEVEAQVVGCSSVMGWGLVKFREGGGVFGNPMHYAAIPIEKWKLEI